MDMLLHTWSTWAQLVGLITFVWVLIAVFVTVD